MKLPRGIRQRGQSYLVDVQEGGIRKTLTVKTLKEAIEMRTLLRAELCAGGVVKRTLGDAYKQACEESWDHAKSKKSRETSTLNARCALAFFREETAVEDITRDDVTAYEAHLRGTGISDATVNRKMSALSKMLTVSVEHGWMEKRPVIHRKREGRGRIRVLSAEEETALLGLFMQWGKVDYYESAIVLLDTGFRMGELWDLERYQVNPEWVHPRTGDVVGLIIIDENKTDLPRSLPMTERVRHIMIKRLQSHSNKLFPYTNRQFEHVWDRAKFIMGLAEDKQFVPYACRHTCASRLLQKGMELAELQVWLGHKNITMTMRYAHLCPTALIRGARLLEGVNHERLEKGLAVQLGHDRGVIDTGVRHASPRDAIDALSGLRSRSETDSGMAKDIRTASSGALGDAGEKA